MHSIELPDCCPSAHLGAAIIEQHPATLAVALAGEIDADNGDHLVHVLSACLAEPRSEICVIMADVTFIGSSGVRVLVQQCMRAEDLGCRLVVRDPHPAVRRVLEITGLLEMLGLAPGPARLPRRTETLPRLSR